MWIQVLLIVGAVASLLAFARFEHGVRMQASKKLAFFGFVALTVYSVLRPNDVNWVANRLGVGRGADLILYTMAIAMIFLVLNTFMRFRAIDRQMTDLVRALALREAERDNAERLGAAAMRGESAPASD